MTAHTQHVQDSALIERMMAGDEAALSTLYDRYSPMLFGMLTRVLKDRQVAEEVLQDLFLQLWRDAGQFDATRGSLPAWLMVIARNRAISRLRGRRDREVMEEEKPRSLTFNLNNNPKYDTGLVCGGTLEIFIEPVLPSSLLYIFGAGHVAIELFKAARNAGFDCIVTDDREAYANTERFPGAQQIIAKDFDEVLAELTPGESSYIVIVTRGHRDDMRVLKLAIATPARYIAMIGSKRKVLNVIRELRKEGVPRAAFERIHAPMGLNIGAISPEEIAISVAAEMIAVRRGAASNWRSLSMSVFADESLRAVLAQ